MLDGALPGDSDDHRRIPQPGELWSLWAVMKMLGIGQFAYLGDEIRRVRSLYYEDGSFVAAKGNSDPQLTDAFKKAVVEVLNDMAEAMSKLDVPEMAQFLRRHTEEDEIPIDGGIYNTLCKAFFDGASSKNVFFMDRKETELFRNSFEAFGSSVTQAFKNVRPEIECAAKCLAFGLPTAAVFHLMRAMERAVRQMATHLGATYADDADWGSVIAAIDKKIDDMPKGLERTRWSEARKNLWHVKEAVRNEVMHPRKEGYTQDQAEENFRACKAFLTHMASLITPPKPPTVAPSPAGKPVPRRL